MNLAFDGLARQFSVQLAHLDVVPASACTPRPSRSTTSSGGSASRLLSICVALPARWCRSGSAEAPTPPRSPRREDGAPARRLGPGDAQQRL